MWFSWLLFVLLWRKIKPMMCLAHIRVCGTEIRYSAVFQASLNLFKRLPAKNTSASFHFKCIRFSSQFGLWRFLADSWGKGANGFGDVDGTGVSRALLQFCLRMVFFLFVKAIVHLMPSCSYLKPLSVQFSREQYSHFVTVNHILLLKIKKNLWLIFSFFFPHWKHGFQFHYRLPVTQVDLLTSLFPHSEDTHGCTHGCALA